MTAHQAISIATAYVDLHIELFPAGVDWQPLPIGKVCLIGTRNVAAVCLSPVSLGHKNNQDAKRDFGIRNGANVERRSIIRV